MIKNFFILIVSMFLLAACQKPAGLTGTSWELVEIEGQPLIEGTRATLEFTEDGSAGGFAGCNSFGASSVEFKGQSIQFQDLAQTEMACLEDSNNLNSGLMDQESRYMQALNQVRSYDMEGESLVLLGESSERLLLFKPISE